MFSLSTNIQLYRHGISTDQSQTQKVIFSVKPNSVLLLNTVGYQSPYVIVLSLCGKYEERDNNHTCPNKYAPSFNLKLSALC